MIGSGEQPTITRYDLDKRGQARPGRDVSVANYGVTAMADDAVTFVSENNAYYADGEQNQLVLFDPKKMEVSGTIDVSAANRDGFQAYIAQAGRAVFTSSLVRALAHLARPNTHR